jgi:hypothetical protein
LLTGQRAVPRESKRARLTIAQILAWADAHHRRTGDWPHARCGAIVEVPGETWRGVDDALQHQQRGLRTGGSLTQLLSKHRGIRFRAYAPRLTEQQILAWADAHHRRTGVWPKAKSGPIPDAPGETWRAVDTALRQPARGLKRRMSLARFLAKKRGFRNRTNLPPLRVKQILLWAKAHHRRTGKWPASESGPIHDALGETWKGVDQALYGGYRGLPGGTSLARLLAQDLSVRNSTNLPRLTYQKILSWADAHYQRTRTWPNQNSGPIGDALGESWSGVNQALKGGYRGLPGGPTLAQFLHKHRRMKEPQE